MRSGRHRSALRRARRWVADCRAELFARWVARASTDQLEAVMQSPLRGVLLWQVFRTMRQRFDGDRASGVDAVVEFRIRRSGAGRADCYQVMIAGGRCETTRGPRWAATVTLDMGAASFLRLVGGAAGAPKLVLLGKLRVWGDPLLAARLPGLLNIPRPPASSRRR